MAVEIERKFLVTGTNWQESISRSTHYHQGYLAADQQITVRIRKAEDIAYLTLKGKRCQISRAEYEYPVPLGDAEELLQLCGRRTVQKVRHLVEHQGHTWEVDVFDGENAPLVIAELELQSEAEPFSLPDWLGKEVSTDPCYSNSYLANNPYSTW
ncbi:MAG TPA: adenylate cyclase [Lentisphaeria bacterium]|jgi:adenylate cyclase|nr:adenylate cyclase [Lentisphaeria bacterium]